MEGVAVEGADVGGLFESVEVEDEVGHFLISRFIIKGYNRNSIIQLESKRVDRVIHQHNIRQRPVLEDPQIFNIHFCLTMPARHLLH